MLRAEHTFETGLVGDVEGGMIPRNSVLCIATRWCSHFVECRNTVSGLEFKDAWAYRVNNAGDVIALVYRC